MQLNQAQDLLGIPKEPFGDLTEMQKEIETLEKLYNLYNQVTQDIEIWNTINFLEMQKEHSQIDEIKDKISKFISEGKRLGKDLKK